MTSMQAPFGRPRYLVSRRSPTHARCHAERPSRDVQSFVRLFARIAAPLTLVTALVVPSVARAADEAKKSDEAGSSDAEGDSASSSATATSASVDADLAPSPTAGAGAGPAAGDHLLFLEGGFRQDWGTFSRQETSGANVIPNVDDYETFHSMFHFGFLERIDDRVRLGGAFGYGGSYRAGNELLGQLLTLDMRVEYGIPLAPKWAFIGTPRFGLSMIIPGGILADRINELQLFGYNTWSGPRFGFLVGGDVGARYALTPWLSARATVGYAWFIMLLLNSHASDGDISSSVSWTTQASRLSGNLGLEISF